MFKKLFAKLKSNPASKSTASAPAAVKTTKSAKPKSTKKAYPNRFLKFYHENKSRVNKTRRNMYTEHRKAGLCVRCSKKAASGVVFCAFHQQKQNSYNKKARS